MKNGGVVMRDARKVFLLLAVLSLLLGFILELRAEEKKVVGYWIREQGIEVFLNFPSGFPVFSESGKAGFYRRMVGGEPKILGSNFHQHPYGVIISFLCANRRQKNDQVKRVISVLKEMAGESIKLEKVPPPSFQKPASRTSSLSPSARVSPRAFYFIEIKKCGGYRI